MPDKNKNNVHNAVNEIRKLDSIFMNYIIKKWDLPLWPIIRYQIMSRIYNKKMDLQTAHKFSYKPAAWKKILYFFHTLKYGLFSKIKKGDALFFINSSTNTLINNKYFDRIYGYYFPFHSPAIFEHSSASSYKLPKSNYSFISRDYYDHLIVYLSKFKNLSSKNKDFYMEIEPFINELKNQFSGYFLPKYFDQLRTYLIRTLSRYEMMERVYSGILRKVRPDICYIHCASYGGYESLLVRICRNNGIPVAEFQHGFIGNTSFAYQYDDSVLENIHIKNSLPDYFLLFGEYWKTRINIPGQTITIGNPYLYSILNKPHKTGQKSADPISNQINSDKKIILIISQGTLTEKFIELTLDLLKIISDSHFENKYTLYYKLHPGEILFEERYQVLYNVKNCTVFKNENIFDLIERSDFIIGCYSTTLMEALVFSKPVFILENDISKELIPENIGHWFTTPEELFSFITLENQSDKENLSDPSLFWDKNYNSNYTLFLNKIKH